MYQDQTVCSLNGTVRGYSKRPVWHSVMIAAGVFDMNIGCPQLLHLTCVPNMVQWADMSIGDVRLNVVFFRTNSGTEPVRR